MTAIMNAFTTLGDATADQVAEHTGLAAPQVNKYLGRMATAGDVMRVNGDTYRSI